jgi:DNA-directed RNA polymerase specialized sigma24 family protein
MGDGGSVTLWIDGIKAGDERATQELWDRYFRRLVGLAAKRLPLHVRREFDEEDVAISAFQSFCGGAAHDRFPHLTSRDQLWRILAVITVRKALAAVRRRSCLKRGGGAVVGESVLFDGFDTPADFEGFGGFIGDTPSPEIAAEMAEEYERLMKTLGDERLRIIARMRMEGYSTEEIARHLDVASRTVDRKLRLIRETWEGHSPDAVRGLRCPDRSVAADVSCGAEPAFDAR